MKNVYGTIKIDNKVFLLFIFLISPAQAAVSSVQTKAIVQQTNGQIVAANTAVVNSMQQLWIARYNTDGSLDSSFGAAQNGIAIPSIGTLSVATSIGIQSTGDIIAGGYAAMEGIAEFAVAAYTSAGNLDTSFGAAGTGIVTTLIGTASIAYALAIQSDNSVVQAGIAIVGGVPELALVRLTPAGLLDSSFGTGGIVTTAIGTTSSVQALAIQSDGKIVAAGWAQVGGIQQIALARYNTDGSLDNAFGTGGIVTQAVGSGVQVYAVAIDGSGNILAGGASAGKFMVARFTSAGVLDSTFGTGGIVTTTVGTTAQVNALLIQASGNIIAVGNSDSNASLVRYTPAGAVDTTFGVNGIIISELPQPTVANAAIIKSDNNLLIAGSVAQNALLLGFTENGILDSTWGVQGLIYQPGGLYLDQTAALYDQQAQGASDGTFTAGAWQTRTLNVITGGTQNISLLNNQIILQQGAFEIEVSAPAYKVGSHQIRLQDVTNGVTLGYGTSSSADVNSQTVTTSQLQKVVFISEPTALEVQHQCQTTEANDGFGLAGNFGPEIYTTVSITQRI